MIPTVVPPLTGLNVLVTRPQPQADVLAAAIRAMGGDCVVFPSLAIERIAATAVEPHDLVIFVSVHAVEFGSALIQKTSSMRIAAIGRTTAAALAAANLPADIVPSGAATSEGLLDHPDIQSLTVQRVLIVRGEGGRETLREHFSTRGSIVNTLEVYRRVKATASNAAIAALETRWAEGEIDVVTATSVETYLKLEELLTDKGRALLHETTLLAPSQRIVDAATESGWHGNALLSTGADDAAIIGTLARWRARARVVRTI